MKNIKEKLKKNLGYISSSKLSRSAIIIIIILFTVPQLIYRNKEDKSTEDKRNDDNKLAVEDQIDSKKGIASGIISTDVDKSDNISSHTLSNGFSELKEETILSNDESTNSSVNSNSNSSTKNSMTSNNNIESSHVDKSSISGLNIQILEGSTFNPKKDLELRATDNDGKDISYKIVIENNVDVNTPGVYKVKTSVKLSNGKIKQREFKVIVKAVPIDVTLQSFKPLKEIVKKGEQIVFDLDVKISKDNVEAVSAVINGKEYNLEKVNKNYKVTVDKDNNAGLKEYNLQHLKMSNNSTINLGKNIAKVEVLKDEATIKNFSYEEQNLEKRIKSEFDLEDKDNTASNLKLELYKDNKLVQSQKLEKLSNYTIYLPIDSNGYYEVKILADICLNQNTYKNSIIYDKEIYNTSINISNIDHTSIIGESIEVIQGEKIDLIKDLSLKATDFDGEDITDKIVVENNVDTNNIGTHTIYAYVINKNNKKHGIELNVEVKSKNENKKEFSLSRMLFGKDDKTRSVALSSFNSSTVIGNDTQDLTHNVKVDGLVAKSDGTMPNGKLMIELPTTMAFTVDQDGNFKSGTYKVVNKSSVGVSIAVSNFIDPTKNSGITVKPIRDNISSLDRSNLHLALVGNNNNYVDLGDLSNSTSELLTVNPSDTGIIQLLGESGKGSNKNVDDNGVTEDFTLVFKIKKN